MKGITRRFTNEALAIASVLCVGYATAPRAEAATGNAGEKAAIAATAEAFVAAFHKGDAKAIAAFWTPDGDYVDEDGRMLKGRKAIEDSFAELFAAKKGLKVRIDVASLRFLAPDLAIEDGTSAVMSPDGEAPSRARYSNVLVKRDGKWLLTSVREAPDAGPSNHEFLDGLDWMVGEWVDDNAGAAAGRVVVEWTPGQNFLVSTRTAEFKDASLLHGTQWIGWDPVAKHIRSWSFEGDGGFGESVWTKDGSKWVIKTSATVVNGGKVTGTIIVSPVDENTVAWQFKDQTLDGKPLPDSKEIKMKRVQSVSSNDATK